MRILNLGCGTKTSDHPAISNVDWSIYLRLRRNRISRHLAPWVLRGERKRRFQSLPNNVVVHDLSRGIPAADGSIDAVYHSHLLEHLDRPVASQFMAEVRRVLRPGGIQRIVVPDLELICRDLLAHLGLCSEPEERAHHDERVAELTEQSVRREAFGMRHASGPWRVLERFLVGDARRRGETHQWMYDWANLTALLEGAGFSSVEICDFETSRIASWTAYGLDRGEAGREYKPGSLYVEAERAA